MKKLLFAALLGGACFWFSPAKAETAPSFSMYEELAEIPDADLSQVIQKAAASFGISEETAWEVYRAGELTVNEQGNGWYRVEYMGGIDDILVDDTL